jgi:hypothetical protein
MLTPKYKTLQELKDAIDNKDPLTTNAYLTIDNDSTSIYSEEDEDGDCILLFDGGMPEALLKEALDLLGIPNRPA